MEVSLPFTYTISPTKCPPNIYGVLMMDRLAFKCTHTTSTGAPNPSGVLRVHKHTHTQD